MKGEENGSEAGQTGKGDGNRGLSPVVQKNKLCLFSAVVVFSCALCGCSDSRPRPNGIPVMLEKSGIIADFQFEIVKHEYYIFYFNFPVREGDQTTRLRLHELLGKMTRSAQSNELIHPGIPIPVRISILNVSEGVETPIYSNETTPMLYSYGTRSFKSRIVRCILMPGKYRAHLENLRFLPEFSGIPVSFQIMKRPNSTLSESEANQRNSKCIN